jgi:hypothetical protein
MNRKQDTTINTKIPCGRRTPKSVPKSPREDLTCKGGECSPPAALNQAGQELTEEDKNVRELWRMRRFLRDQRGLPVDTQPRTQSPRAKRQRTPQLETARKSPSLTRSENDPERDTHSGRYSPTEGNREEDEYEEYDEMKEDNA